MKELLNKKSTEYIILMLFSVTVIVWNLRCIKDIDLIFAMDDEFGYWANAAFFAGKDWSGTVSQCLYYNWGYSLILTPLFWIFESTYIMRKVALLINICLVVGMMLLLYSLGKKLFPSVNKYITMVGCFFATFFPYIQVQNNMTMSEIYISFLVVVLFYFMHMYIVEQKKMFSVLSTLVAGMLYFVHQRNLGILIAVLLIMIVMFFRKKIKITSVLINLAVFAGFIFINEIVKDYLQTNLWENGRYISVNDFSGMQSLFDFSGMASFFSVLCGQLLYLFDSTYGLFGIAIVCIIINITKGIKQKEDSFVWNVFLILAFLGNYGISCIFMRGAIRWDNVIYGRYNESLILFFIIFGILSFLSLENSKHKIRIVVVTIISMVLLTIVVQLYYNNAEFINQYYNYYCAVSLPVYPTADNNFAIYISTIVGVIGLLIFAVASLRKEALLVVLILMTINYNDISNKYIKGTLVASMWGSQQYETRARLVDYLDKNSDDKKIYFLITNSGVNNMPKGYYQFLLCDKEIICVEYDEIKNITEECYVIIGDFYEPSEEFNDKFTPCNNQMYLYEYSK